MDFRQRAVRIGGVVGGLCLCVHGLLPRSGSLPLLWPLIAGAVVVGIGRTATGTSPSASRALAAAFQTGAIAAIVGFMGLAIGYVLLTRPEGAAIARSLGADGSLPLTRVAFVALLVAALLAVPAALIGGLLALPIRNR